MHERVNALACVRLCAHMRTCTDDMASDCEPQLLAQLVIVLGLVGMFLGQFQVASPQCKCNSLAVQAHDCVHMHTREKLVIFKADPLCIPILR